MKKLEIMVTDKTFEQMEKLVDNLQELLDTDTVEHLPVTKDLILANAIHSAYLQKFHPNPMNIVLIQHTYVQLLDLIKDQEEIYKHLPIGDFSDVKVTPLKIISELIEREYNRLHGINQPVEINEEDLPI